MSSAADHFPPQGFHQLKVDQIATFEPETLPALRRRWVGLAVLLIPLVVIAFAPLLRGGPPMRAGRLALSSASALDRASVDVSLPGSDGWESIAVEPAAKIVRAAQVASPARALLQLERQRFDRASARPFRAVGVALVAFNAILFFAVAQRLSLRFPWLAAALVAVTPLGSGAAGQLSGQPILLAGLFGLAATLLYFRAAGIDRRDVVPPIRLRLPRSPLVLRTAATLLAVAALLCSPIASVFPLLWLVTGAWRLGRRGFRGIDRGIAIALAVVGLGFGMILRAALAGENLSSLPADLFARVAFAPRIAWLALSGGLLPRAAAIWHPLGTSPAAIDWLALAAVAGLAAFALVRFKSPALRAAIVAFAGLLLVPALLAARSLGEIGVTDGQLWFAWMVPAALLALATARLARIVGDRREATRAAVATAANEQDADVLTEPAWARPARGLAAMLATVAVCAPAFARSFGYASTPTFADAVADRSPVAARERLFDALDHNDGPAAQTAAARYARLNPDRGEPLVYQARLLRLTTPDSAGEQLRLFREAVAKSPLSSHVQAALADALFRAGSVDEAKQTFARAVELDPGNLDALNNLAAVEQRLDHLDAAEGIFRSILARDPSYSTASINFAGLLLNRGKADEAFSTLDHALGANPRDARLYAVVGLIFLADGKNDAAIAAFQAGAKLDPSPASLTNLGNALATAKRYEDARLFFDRAIKLNSRFAPALSGLQQIDELVQEKDTRG